MFERTEEIWPIRSVLPGMMPEQGCLSVTPTVLPYSYAAATAVLIVVTPRSVTIDRLRAERQGEVKQSQHHVHSTD